MSNFDPEKPLQQVQKIYDATVRGMTTGRTKRPGTDLLVEIQFGANDKRFVEFDDLEIVTLDDTSILGLLKAKKFGGAGDFARILTYHKINSNLSNVFYAMQASRTDFYPHQFKPVYKFIESLDGRILIADEVGLGKTIEAGLIWLETKARNPEAKRLLVICPPMLREKWKKELRTRFETKAEIYDANGILSLLGDFKRERNNYACEAVCSLNSIRQDKVLEKLKEFEDENLEFDLVVIDESHHLRNVSTKSHKAGEQLSDLTDKMILLSATPIQLKDEDLFRQLQILNREEFDSHAAVQERLRANEPIVRAQRLLRQNPPRIADAFAEINSLADSVWFRERELFHLIKNQLENLTPENRAAMTETNRRLENLNLFSSTISRTQKREVQENRVVREAKSLQVRFSDEEMQFYDDITEAVQNRVSAFSGNFLSGFALMMPQRMMASSIPAMVEYYRGTAEWDEEVFDSINTNAETNGDENREISWLALENLVEDWDLNLPDSKFEVLLDALQNLRAREQDGKIIVFSFFKRTLEYLRRRLSAAGFQPLVIHGDVKMEERGEIIEKFEKNPAHNILLSSEVGSEGIDLQFCRVIINYDLPWNPMKVEQRIGRVDRLGQKADKITILNLAVADTIEEKI